MVLVILLSVAALTAAAVLLLAGMIAVRALRKIARSVWPH